MRYICKFVGYVEVEADSPDDAADMAYPDDVDDWDLESVEEDEDYSEKGPDPNWCCLDCAHCTRYDEVYKTIDCEIDGVPNGHKQGHVCALFEEAEEDALLTV